MFFSILMITIDTLRADHLGCYGYQRETSPHLDALAREAILFRRAYSPCSYTLPAHASIMTGKYVPHHSVGYKQGDGKMDPDREVTLAEILLSLGWSTAAFVSCAVLDASRGLSQGFVLYDDEMTRGEENRPHELVRDGPLTTARALAWLKDNTGKPFFVWIHYFDVHGPYIQPAPFNTFFRPEDYGNSSLLLPVVNEGEAGGIPRYQLLADDSDGVAKHQHDARFYLARYDCGIRYQDHIVGDLFQTLKEMGLWDELMVIVTADHGEALGENGVYFYHGLTLTPDQIHVPLIAKMPRSIGPAGVQVDVPVSTVDIMPTVLELIGFDYSRLALDGLPLQYALYTPDLVAQRAVHCDLECQGALICGKELHLWPRTPTISSPGYLYNPSLVSEEIKIYLF
ncbi:sulfatase [Desulfofundulus thermosubterraneus]|uniref:Arylsulfatase n=1 Tax=Desulfofundulus thermosubterraneus DSM 16057 TaxID=1121432 RepID=A0A1M6D6H7_9FIRM|nr:sulfatase [Desulfofundulus thermosubterraneus]SHI68810.1 arylsulfatase [Desulfofundulus thermosubterraneus DSM 16057]